jgi:hypothetical protein
MEAFESPLAVRIEETVFACLEFPLTALMIVVLGAVPGGIVWMLVDPWLGIVVGIALCWFFYPVAWDGFLGRLRFCIQFHPDRLQVGRRWATRLFPYDLVEKIALPRPSRVRYQGSKQVEITCFDDDTKVYLNDNLLGRCLGLLRERCCNAIFVDEAGREYLPENAIRPDFTLMSLRKHYRRWMYRWIAGFLVSIYLTLSLVAMVTIAVQGNFDHAVIHLIVHVVFGPPLLVTSLYMMLDYRRKVRIVSAKMQELSLPTELV